MNPRFYFQDPERRKGSSAVTLRGRSAAINIRRIKLATTRSAPSPPQLGSVFEGGKILTDNACVWVGRIREGLLRHGSEEAKGGGGRWRIEVLLEKIVPGSSDGKAPGHHARVER